MELRHRTAASRSGRASVRARTVGAVFAVGAIAVALLPAPALAQTVTIQPGAAIVNEGGGQCTMNWVYDGTGARAGRVYVGTARHCVNRLGERVTLQSGTFGRGVVEIGTVAFMSRELDSALIEVAEENESLVSPAMRGHPSIPSGVSTRESSSFGDLVQFSGNGVGFHTLSLTREQRVGVLHFNDGTHWSALGPVTPGDSGGPAANLTDGNRALGIVTVLCAGTTCAGAGGVSLEGLLQDAADSGFTVRLRTV